MPTPEDAWHYPREALADRILATLDSGLVSAITLFAPRRMGKTEFATRDLAPRAVARGWIVAYANLWADETQPAGVIVSALDRVAAGLRKPKRSGKVGAALNLGLVNATAEVQEEVPAAAPPTRIMEAFAEIAALMKSRAKGRKLLLLVDEIQHLANDKRFGPIASALRTALETHAAVIKAVFTGSSQAGLHRMFLDTRAAFFSPGGQLELEPLGDDFVRFVVRRAGEVFKRKVDFDEAKAIFEASGRSPYFLRQAVCVALLQQVPLGEGLERVLDDTLNDERLRRRWSALNALDRAVAQLVLSDAAPYSAASIEQLAAATGQKDITPARVQTSLKRLEREGFVERGLRGAYGVADPLVALWLRRGPRLLVAK